MFLQARLNTGVFQSQTHLQLRGHSLDLNMHLLLVRLVDNALLIQLQLQLPLHLHFKLLHIETSILFRQTSHCLQSRNHVLINSQISWHLRWIYNVQIDFFYRSAFFLNLRLGKRLNGFCGVVGTNKCNFKPFFVDEWLLQCTGLGMTIYVDWQCYCQETGRTSKTVFCRDYQRGVRELVDIVHALNLNAQLLCVCWQKTFYHLSGVI